jgi:hypothetical protein
MTNNSTIATETEIAIVNNLTWDDATWILTSSFIIFTMQSGKFMSIIKCRYKTNYNTVLDNLIFIS